MKAIDKTLDDLDEFLNSKKDNEKYMYFFLPILIFGFLAYQFVFPITDNMLNEQINRENDLKDKIVKVNQNLAELTNANNQLPAAIKRDNNKHKVLLNEKEQVDALVKQLDFLKFNIIKWGFIYNQIPEFAKVHNLVIEKLDNDVNFIEKEKGELVSNNMTITIEVNGRYINMLKFLENFENRKELVQVKELNSELNKSIIKIDVFGANL
jgi:hypothetical protein